MDQLSGKEGRRNLSGASDCPQHNSPSVTLRSQTGERQATASPHNAQNLLPSASFASEPEDYQFAVVSLELEALP